MNKILLIDVDSKIPNIALMKLSSYYKTMGYIINLQKLNYDGYPHKRNSTLVFANEYEKVFVSTIFTQNKNVVSIIGCEDITYGGSGYDVKVKLPQEIDDQEEDYSIYEDNKISYGFITRGCIRKCYFCNVPEKEGLIHKYRNVDQVAKHKITMFLDNNILSYNKHEEVFQELIDKNIKCQFNQGLDIRLVTEKNMELLSKIRYYKEYIFAFDQVKDLDEIERNLKIVKKYIPTPWKIKMFIYVSPKMDLKDDVMFRVEWCKKNEVLPYIMRDKSCWDSKDRKFYLDLASYCNQPSFFKKKNFYEFLQVKQAHNKLRIISHMNKLGVEI